MSVQVTHAVHFARGARTHSSPCACLAPPAGIDIGPDAHDPSLPQPSVNQSSRPLSEEQLDGILSPELDKMVTDGKLFALHLGFLKDMSKYDFQRFLHAYLQFNFH